MTSFLAATSSSSIMPLRVARVDQLVVDLDLVGAEGDVLLGLDLQLLAQLLGRHLRDLDLLDDHRVAGDRGGDLLVADAQRGAQAADGIDDGALVHDRAVDDGLRRQRLDAEIEQADPLGGLP